MNNFPLKKFYFLRHGETEWNRLHKIMGQTDIPLNETGEQQAQRAERDIRELNLTSVHASPLKRAFRTAEIINQIKKLPLSTHEGLMERCWGEEEGYPHKQFLSQIPDHQLPIGAEPWSVFSKRVMHALNEILESSTTPLIVAHGGVFVAIINAFGSPDLRAGNCDIFLFQPPLHKSTKWFISNLNFEGAS